MSKKTCNAGVVAGAADTAQLREIVAIFCRHCWTERRTVTQWTWPDCWLPVRDVMPHGRRGDRKWRSGGDVRRGRCTRLPGACLAAFVT